MGLVTHSRSRFNSQGQSTESFIELATQLDELGLSNDSIVSDRNDFELIGEKIGLVDRLKSAWWQVKVERAWTNYLRNSQGSVHRVRNSSGIFFMGMFIKRAISFSFDSRVLERLANIDLSHLRILDEGIASGADWILVIEDDASYRDVHGIAEKIQKIYSHLSDGGREVFLNLSESIGTEELRVDQLLANSSAELTLSGGTKLLKISPPVSNTVCANMYSRSFAITFAEAIRSQGVLPSIPIDWRLNQLILSQDPSFIDCFWLVPGAFIQGSMHPVGQ